jgi:hypothetical protein
MVTIFSWWAKIDYICIWKSVERLGHGPVWPTRGSTYGCEAIRRSYISERKEIRRKK